VDSDRVRPRLVLASASPARRRSLRAAGIDADVVLSGVDESSVHASGPEVLSGMLARLKAQAVAERLRRDLRGERVLVLGCDSVLAFDGEVLGKPGSPAEAVARWRRMRGKQGVLHTGHALVEVGTGRLAEAVAATRVQFAEVSDEEIAAYVATGEPLAVAGGFTIDGIGGPFVARIEGDPGTVIGLSLPLLRRLLADLGVPITALWHARHTVT
jgi:septum formation protein